MKKIIIITALLALVAMAGQGQIHYRIEGNIGHPDFTGTLYLSDYVGRGQYVLVDFWASWCGPCRAEIPNIIAAYIKYRDKGLQVIGIAAWDKPEDTLRAIEEEKIPYPQILNTQKIATDLYGINGIPEIILFAPDGTILARGLRGEEIEKKLAEIFKDK